jgi:hypothetical protein
MRRRTQIIIHFVLQAALESRCCVAHTQGRWVVCWRCRSIASPTHAPIIHAKAEFYPLSLYSLVYTLGRPADAWITALPIVYCPVIYGRRNIKTDAHGTCNCAALHAALTAAVIIIIYSRRTGKNKYTHSNSTQRRFGFCTLGDKAVTWHNLKVFWSKIIQFIYKG